MKRGLHPFFSELTLSSFWDLLGVLFIILNQLGKDLFDFSCDDDVGDSVYRRVGIGVDGDYERGVLHSGDMLDLSRDSTSDIELRADGHTGLTNLAVMIYPTGVNGSAACAYFSSEGVCKFFEELEILFGSNAITTCNDDRATLEVNFRFLDMTVYDGDDEIFRTTSPL